MDQNIADFLTDAFSEPNFEHLHFDDDTAMAHSVDVSQDMPAMEDAENSNRESSESDSEEDDDTTAANNINTPQNAANMEDDDNNSNHESSESESEVDLEFEKVEYLHSDDNTAAANNINTAQNAPDMDDDDNSNQESSESEYEVDLESKNREHLHSDDDTGEANHINTPQNAPDMEDDNNSDQESSELDSESDLEFEKREHLHSDDDTKAANNIKSPQNAPDMEDNNNSDQESSESDSEVDLESKNREHQHSDDDNTTEHSMNTPQNTADMQDDEKNNREYSGTEFDLDLECKNREEEIKNCSENNSNFSLDEQSMKPGSTLGGSFSNSDENKTPTQDQHLSLHDEECREDLFEDIHQAEDDNVLKMALRKGTPLDLDTMSSHKVTTSHLLSYQMVDEPENESSASEEDTVEPKSTEDDNKLYSLSSTLQDWPVASMDVQSGDELKEFTEDDLEREEEGLAEYPSDLSRSDSGDSGEGQTMNTKLDHGLGWSGDMKKMEELTLSYQAVTLTKDAEDVSVDHADVLTYVKNDDPYETTTSRKSDDILFQTKQDSFRDGDYSSEISNAGESSDFEIGENVQSSSSDSYKNEQPEYDGDISSDGDYSKIQDEKPDLPFPTEKNKPTLLKQVHTFIEEFPTDVELEVGDVLLTDSQNPERCDVSPSSIHPRSEKEGSPEKHSTETSSSELYSLEASKQKDNNEDITVLLPGTFWSVMDEDNMKFDEYDWDINGEEALCDEEDNLLEDLENEGEGSERDWEKEKERIKAFNKYYDTVEGEENRDRSHLVTFCLEPKYSLYEEESDSSEDDHNTKCCMYELHPSESSLVQDQSNNDNSRQVSDTLENISAVLKDEDNVMLDEYDYGFGEEEFYKTNSSKTILDDEDDFLEKLKIEIEREMQQERTEALNKFYEESGQEKHEVTDRSQKGLYGLHQDSQNEEDNESSEQESYTEDDTSSALKIKDQSDSDEPHERRLYTGKHKVLIKGLQRTDKQLKEPPKRNKCVFLLRSVFALSLVTVVGLLSYCWATDNMDLLNTDGSSIFNMIQNRQ